MDIQGFMNDLALDTQSRETLRAYRQTLEKYEAFLRSRRLRVTQAKPSTIREFLQHMAENHGRLRGDQPSKATVAQRLAILSSFYEYLGRDSDGEVRNPVDRVKVVGNQLCLGDLDSVRFFEVGDKFQDASRVNDPLLKKGIIIVQGLSSSQKKVVYNEAAQVCCN